MIPRYLENTLKLHSNWLSNGNILKVKAEHLINSRCLHQLQNQEALNSIKNNDFPLKNNSKTTNIDHPHYISCIHKPLEINLQKTDSVNGNRKYLSKFPSVTTILSNTKPSSEFFGLMQWRKANIEKLGKEKFNVMQRNTTTKGTHFHQEMKYYFSNMDNIATPPDVKIENSGFFQSVGNVLPDMINPLAIESSVVHSELGYAGTVDLVAEYLGKLSIVDWKTSQRKRTKLQDCHSYPVQLAAYAGAINYDDDYPFQVSNGVLVIAYENGDPADIHVLDEQVLQEFWDKWLIRLNKYKAKYKDDIDWDIKGTYSTVPNDISTSGPLNDILEQGTNLNVLIGSNKSGTKEGLIQANKEPVSSVYLRPIVDGARKQRVSKADGLNVAVNSVQSCGKRLNEIGQTVKDEEVISSWRTLSGVMEGVFGEVYLSKGLLYSHYMRTLFNEVLFGNKLKKKDLKKDI